MLEVSFTLIGADQATYLFQIFSEDKQGKIQRLHGGLEKPQGRRTQAV